jgi:hypothetical protein
VVDVKRGSPLTVLGVLALGTITFMLIPRSPATGLIVIVIAGLLVCELDRSGQYLAISIVDLASRLLPRERRADFVSEGLDHLVLAGENGLRPVIAALSMVRAAVALGFRYRLRVAVALHLMRAAASSADSFIGVIVAMHRRHCPRVVMITGSAIWVVITASLHFAYPNASKWSAWVRAIGGLLSTAAAFVLVVVVFHLVLPTSLVGRLVGEGVMWSAMGWTIGWLITEPDRIFLMGAWIGGKPVADAIDQTRRGPQSETTR